LNLKSCSDSSKPVHGAIRDFWIAEGWERGPSGYPTYDEKESNNRSFDRMQDFDKRQI